MVLSINELPASQAVKVVGVIGGEEQQRLQPIEQAETLSAVPEGAVA